ncbi:MAG: deoxyribose-phosphate aldolase [Gammaproteobacteria bacterium RIFCSPHIGHO2_12_FULL_45_9]|nr:MAG: deoxyribose-phosphate aldolase [Gammaproteobacteria bacterium RIFCSPHIGHO2_12_FULL_45_9]
MQQESPAWIRCLDLTSLNDTDDAARIDAVCDAAVTPWGPVAAVCIAPSFVAQVVRRLTGSGIRVATVSNFPTGESTLEETWNEIHTLLQEGADEIDVVLPYHAFLAGELGAVEEFLLSAREACQDACLKVILETGALCTADSIRRAADIALTCGADFVKTSTGKMAQGATPEAVKILAEAVLAMRAREPDRVMGVKVSGGVRTTEDAARYIAIVEQVWEQPVQPSVFRLGSSQLVRIQ